MRLRFSQVLCVVLLAGVFVFLSDGLGETEEGLASYYGPELAGQPTASGEPFDPYGFTAAHKSLPLGTQLMVTYGGRSVQVTVNDRGPYTGGRDLDLSQGAAEYLGLTAAGVDYVAYDVVGGSGYGDAGYAGYAGYETEEPAYTGTEDAASYAPAATETYEVGTTGNGEYVVQSGDTLTGIAAELGTTTEALAAANGIEDPNLLYAGDSLVY